MQKSSEPTRAAAGIARQQWRARIETSPDMKCEEPGAGIARQQWRARIETSARQS